MIGHIALAALLTLAGAVVTVESPAAETVQPEQGRVLLELAIGTVGTTVQLRLAERPEPSFEDGASWLRLPITFGVRVTRGPQNEPKIALQPGHLCFEMAVTPRARG
jgi:hypothetical protein